jgi:DNA mismatch repair protein MutL
MGFRGEALPSIAAVSETVMVSRPSGAELGAQIEVEFGEIGETIEAGGPAGTTVEVRNLFCNLPARLKFLKSDRTEWGRIAGVVTHAAAAFPSVAFDLAHNGKRILSVEAHPDIPSRIGRLFDASLADSLAHAMSRLRGVELQGWFSPVNVTRSNMNMVHMYVNSRYVRVPAALRALKDVYGEYLPRGRHPVAFLFLIVPPDAVDVNVHPSKEEVRFKDAGTIHDIVRRAAGEALAGLGASVEARVPSAPSGRPSPVAERPLPYRTPPRPTAPLPSGPLFEASGFLQVHDTYIVVEEEDGILLVDQHALHERILLEELKEKMADGSLERQGLLVPLTVNLTPEEMSALAEIRDCLGEAGITVDDFGENAVAVRSVPALLKNADPVDLVLEAVHETASAADRDSTLREVISRIACRAAVKAGQRLSRQEIAALLKKARETDFAATCAHGRPTQLKLTLADLEKMFERR